MLYRTQVFLQHHIYNVSSPEEKPSYTLYALFIGILLAKMLILLALS